MMQLKSKNEKSLYCISRSSDLSIRSIDECVILGMLVTISESQI